MSEDLVKYYALRAQEYEIIYSKPERQEELNKLKIFLKEEFKNLNVYEAACGTGYWSQSIAESARSVYACDINEEVLEIARSKKLTNREVSFNKEDVFTHYNIPKFNSLFGGFIWSHIPLDQIHKFLDSLESRITDGGKIIFTDNNYVEGSSTPIASVDAGGNSYQLRKLKDGTEYLVLKNFPAENDFKNIFATRNKTFEFINYKYYWILKYNK